MVHSTVTKLAGESVVLILFIRNMFGMIFCFACQPWIDNSGVFWTTITMCVLSIVINGGFAILLVWGKHSENGLLNHMKDIVILIMEIFLNIKQCELCRVIN